MRIIRYGSACAYEPSNHAPLDAPYGSFFLPTGVSTFLTKSRFLNPLMLPQAP
jgi:hypothetical protein